MPSTAVARRSPNCDQRERGSSSPVTCTISRRRKILWLELVYSSETFGRPYMMPPGVPAERVAALRTAFMQTMRDQNLLAEAQRIGVVIDPISGEELQALAQKIFATPAAVVERAKQAMEYKVP